MKPHAAGRAPPLPRGFERLCADCIIPASGPRLGGGERGGTTAREKTGRRDHNRLGSHGDPPRKTAEYRTRRSRSPHASQNREPTWQPPWLRAIFLAPQVQRLAIWDQQGDKPLGREPLAISMSRPRRQQSAQRSWLRVRPYPVWSGQSAEMMTSLVRRPSWTDLRRSGDHNRP